MARKDWVRAGEYFRATVGVNTDYWPGWNNLAWALTQEGKSLDEALQAAEKAKSLVPEKPEILDTLGMVYLAKKNHEKALVTFEQAVRLMSNSPSLRYHLALAYNALGQVEKGKEEIEKALKLNGKFPEQSEAERLLQQWQS